MQMDHCSGKPRDWLVTSCLTSMFPRTSWDGPAWMGLYGRSNVSVAVCCFFACLSRLFPPPPLVASSGSDIHRARNGKDLSKFPATLWIESMFPSVCRLLTYRGRGRNAGRSVLTDLTNCRSKPRQKETAAAQTRKSRCACHDHGESPAAIPEHRNFGSESSLEVPN